VKKQVQNIVLNVSKQFPNLCQIPNPSTTVCSQ